jgi:hypothetical protein
MMASNCSTDPVRSAEAVWRELAIISYSSLVFAKAFHHRFNQFPIGFYPIVLPALFIIRLPRL